MGRQIVELTLPLAKDVVILHPENVILRFCDGSLSLDVGARCYLERRVLRRQRNKQDIGLSVDLSSVDKARAQKIREFVSHLSEEAELGGKLQTTLWHIAYSFLRFLDWCDANQQRDVLKNEERARIAFRAYVESLRERVRRNDININTAAKYQNQTGYLLASLMMVYDLGMGIRQMRMSRQATETTLPPDEDLQGKVLALCEMLFKGASNFVLHNEQYPYKLEMPEYLAWDECILWIFPSIRLFIPPHEWSTHQIIKANPVMDYANGRLFEIDKIAHRYSSRTVAKVSINNAKKSIDVANADKRHHSRRELAMLAHNAFVLMFVAHTGMNWAEVRKLSWDNEFVVGRHSQGFREIKFRANGRQVSFSIQSCFLPTFKKYLDLRRYLLTGLECHTLFFSLGPNLIGPPKVINEQLLSSFHRTLRRIDPGLKMVSPRALRAAKSDWLVRNADISTAALILQNSESIVRQHYMTGSEIRATEEMHGFFERLSTVVLNAEKKIQADRKVGALGDCNKYGNPNQTDAVVSIKPDCHQPEGCLFCNKYVVHANECDMRKLFSCRYCIYQTQNLSASQEHFESLYGEVITRLDAILDQIRGCSAEHAALVDLVGREVEEEGQLDPYWESKLEMLIGIGVVVP